MYGKASAKYSEGTHDAGCVVFLFNFICYIICAKQETFVPPLPVFCKGSVPLSTFSSMIIFFPPPYPWLLSFSRLSSLCCSILCIFVRHSIATHVIGAHKVSSMKKSLKSSLSSRKPLKAIGNTMHRLIAGM
jgi:hypothetical protein